MVIMHYTNIWNVWLTDTDCKPIKLWSHQSSLLTEVETIEVEFILEIV